MTQKTTSQTQSVVDFRAERFRRAVREGGAAAFPVAERIAASGLAEAQYRLAEMLAEREQPGDAEAAKRWYQAAADQGHVEACKALWRITVVNAGAGAIDRSLESIVRAADLGDYQASAVLIAAYGRRPDAPVPNMLAYLQRHVERGHSYAQVSLACAYAEGYFGLPRDAEMAFELHTLAAQGGDAYAMCCVGISYAYGQGVQQDDEQAVHWYLKAARAGSAQAQCNLGYSYEKGRRPLQRSMQDANRWYRRAALRDFEVAQYNLGLSYLHGREMPQNVELANRWFTRAAELGNAAAQVALGYSYETGRGVEVSYSRALELYKAAANSGDAQGQHNYACMLENGSGIEANPHDAARWYAAAAEQGLATAEGNLASMYFDGRGVEKNVAEALKLWRSAADKGLATAQCNLGWLYSTGIEATKNLYEALKYYKLAAEQGSEVGARGIAWVTELADGTNALNALEDRLRAQDPAYEAKRALLVPVLKPVFKQVPPSKWAAAFGEAYAGVQLPAESAGKQQSTRPARHTTPQPPPATTRVSSQTTMTVLLYELDSYPGEIGISKTDPPVGDGAFLLDFNRPLTVLTREFLGILNSRVGSATELAVPIIHQGEHEHAGSFLALVHRRDPRFDDLRALWRARYPKPRRATRVAVGGFKLLADFANQFPDDCPRPSGAD